MSHPVPAPNLQVALSTGSVYPESTARAFEIASRLGFAGLEVMVSTDPVSQDMAALRRLSDHYQVPILSIHAPCLLITQRVWTTDPWVKLKRAGEAAAALGAGVVVVHPPFRWQREYAIGFEAGIARMNEETGVVFAVENMFPWRVRGREITAYLPDWNVVNGDYAHCTLDVSHAATAQADALEMLTQLGERVAHVHLADGSGSSRDEHLVPGRGGQPCAEVLGMLLRNGYSGAVVLEVNTRRAATSAEREDDLGEALAFTRWHLSAPPKVDGQAAARGTLTSRQSNDGLPAGAAEAALGRQRFEARLWRPA